MHRLAPGTTERMFGRMVEHGRFENSPAPATVGNLFLPMPQYQTITGGWRQETRKFSVLGALGVATVEIGLGALLLSSRERRQLLASRAAEAVS